MEAYIKKFGIVFIGALLAALVANYLGYLNHGSPANARVGNRQMSQNYSGNVYSPMGV